MLIPIINTQNITPDNIRDLQKSGFCYVELTDNHLLDHIDDCINIARNFFALSAQEKQMWDIKHSLKNNNAYQGYALRSQSKNTHAIEQFFFEPASPFGPYADNPALISALHNTFVNHIILPIIKAIFMQLNLSEKDFSHATYHPYYSLVFQKCPKLSESKDSVRLNAHKDFGLITVLYFTEPGLEIYYQDAWHAIASKKNCVIVNIGNALEKMTNGLCHSALHRVVNTTDDRLSLVYFVNPNQQQPVMNYIEAKQLFPTGDLFFKQQFTDYYDLEY